MPHNRQDGKKNTVIFTVPGIPAPQGSKRAFVVKGKPVLTESSKGVKPWRAVVSLAAQGAMREQSCDGWFSKEPVQLCAFFYFARPKALPKRIVHKVTRPDLDKLLRAVLDALTGVIYGDDSQVQAILTHKSFGTPGVALECREVKP